MKKILNIILFASLACGILSCQKETLGDSRISIDFQFDELAIDMNVANNPYVTCIVNSAVELDRIDMFILYPDGRQEAFKSGISKFDNPKRHSIYERPVFTDDMSGFRVTVTDKNGSTESGDVSFSITKLVTSPVISFASESISFAEGEEIPAFSFSISAKAPLASVSVELIESGTPKELVPTTIAFESPMAFSFNSSEYTLEDYDFNKIPSAIRVTAIDSYGKIGQSLLPISYRALPSPVVSVSGSSKVDEFTPCSIEGKAESESGIVEIAYYTVGEDYEYLLETQKIDGRTECTFSYNVAGKEILDYINGIKVAVKDTRNKVTEKTLAITVKPQLMNVEEGADLRALILDMAADEKYRSIKLRLAPGGYYELGSNSLTINKNLRIEGDPAMAMPVVSVGASYAFLTDLAVIDGIIFNHIHFESSKSGSGMFNNNGGCTIKQVDIEDCVFDGAFSGAFLRASGGSSISKVILNNSQVYWSNTNGTYSMFHITQNSDRIESISITNSTIGGIFYLMYNNMTNTGFEMEVSHCTFVNQKGSSNGYHISCQNSTLTGTIVMENNLYGGSNNVKSGYRVLRANKMNVKTNDNWCTKSWKTFTDDSTNNSVNPISLLPDSEDNDALFEDAAAMNFTLKAGTSAYTKKIGDPRWIK